MIHIRVPRPPLVFALLSVMIGFAAFVSGSAQAVQSEDFLMPPSGVIQTYANEKGMIRRQRCTQKSKQRMICEEEVCCFGPYSEDGAVSVDLSSLEMTPISRRKSITRHYVLIAEKGKFVMEYEQRKIILLDFAEKEWTVPIFSSPGMPKTEKCKVVSWQSGPYFGKERTLVTVECNACLDGEIVHTETWTLATGIGFVGMTDFKLSSIETTR